MEFYSFDRSTGEYLGPVQARANPRVPGEFLSPAFATTEPPPELPAGQVACWNGSAWEAVQDNRGQEYWLPDGSRHVVTRLRETLPDGVAAEPPAPTLAQVQAAELASLNADALSHKLAAAETALPGEWGTVLALLDYTKTTAWAAILAAETVEAARAVRAGIVWETGAGPSGAA